VNWLRERVQKLLNGLLEAKNEICVKRAEIISQAYKKLEGEDILIKRARALAKILREMPVKIEEGELIVGKLGAKRRSAPIYPEFSWEWIVKEIDDFPTRDGDKFEVREEEKGILRELLPWWRGKTVKERALSKMPQEVIDAMEEGLFTSGNYLNSGVGHLVADYERVLKKGIRGIKEEVLERLESLDLTVPENVYKRTFYEAVAITLDAAVDFARRYSEEAKRLASIEIDEKRREELEKIAEICARVPEFPAKTFWEALQSVWLIHLIFWVESNGNLVSLGRFDQYMYPYYKKSLENGELTREDALEQLECFYIKLSEIIKLYDNKTAKYFGGFPQGQIIVLGGQLPDGQDATNDLSYLCLEAMMEVKTRQPNLAVRIHEGSPNEFVLKACECAKTANAQPEFFNDKTVIPALLNIGIPIHEARNYAVCGCVEIVVPGKTNPWAVASMINFAKCLELAMNNGKSMLTGKQIGPATGDPGEFKSFADVMNAFKKQMEHAAKLVVIAQNCIQSAHAELAPQPFLSAFVCDCIEKGEDFIRGGAKYNFTGPQGVGIASVADSLAAIKKLVFEEKMMTMHKLLEAIRNNFHGECEETRFMLMNKAPKFGNDEDYVDLIAREIGRIHCLSYSQYRDIRGGIYAPGMLSNTAGIMFGEIVAATPDGRRHGEPLSDGVSPVAGRDIKGPTAAFKSVAKLDLVLCSQGAVFNMKMNPGLLDNRERLIKFANLLRAYFELGGFHVQFNIIGDEVLRCAQKEPEKYRDLLVRVAGWCAYFVELAKPVQDEIIRRTAHSRF